VCTLYVCLANESGNLACFKTFELQFEVLLLQCFDVRLVVCFKIFEVPGFNGICFNLKQAFESGICISLQVRTLEWVLLSI
jgi:hypothetical protein